MTHSLCNQIIEIDGRETCRVASYWAGIPVPTNPEACKVCVGCPVPRGLNRVTVSLAMGELRETDPDTYERKTPLSLEYLIPPGAPESVVRYARSTTEWVRQGRPTRTDTEVAQILEICQGCPEWLAEQSACRLCGCHINSGNGWTNKARRLNEHCPKEKW